MTNTLKLIVGLCLLSVSGYACSGQTSDAKEVSVKGETGEAKGETGEAAGSNIDVAQADGREAEATEAYAALVREINEVQRTTPRTEMMQAIAKIESLFKKFIRKYPDSEEALDAKLQLGMIYTSLGRTDEAIKHLEDLIANGEEHSDMVGYGHYYLAEAYKSADRFEKAKEHYSIIITDYQSLGERVTSMARSNIEDIKTLSRLAIGSEPIPFDVVGTKGEKISLARYKGKVVLLDFWATWCGPCRVEMPNVVKVHKKYNKKGFEIIGISLDRSREAFDKYVKSSNMNWPQYFDGKYWQNEVAILYKVRAIPATYLIDRQGKIRYRALKGRQLEEAVEKLVNETS